MAWAWQYYKWPDVVIVKKAPSKYLKVETLKTYLKKMQMFFFQFYNQPFSGSVTDIELVSIDIK